MGSRNIRKIEKTLLDADVASSVFTQSVDLTKGHLTAGGAPRGYALQTVVSNPVGSGSPVIDMSTTIQCSLDNENWVDIAATGFNVLGVDNNMNNVIDPFYRYMRVRINVNSGSAHFKINILVIGN